MKLETKWTSPVKVYILNLMPKFKSSLLYIFAAFFLCVVLVLGLSKLTGFKLDFWQRLKPGSEQAVDRRDAPSGEMGSARQQEGDQEKREIIIRVPTEPPAVVVSEQDLFEDEELFNTDAPVEKFVVKKIEDAIIIAQSGKESREFMIGKNAEVYVVRKQGDDKDKMTVRMAMANALATGLEVGAVLRVETSPQARDKIYYLEN